MNRHTLQHLHLSPGPGDPPPQKSRPSQNSSPPAAIEFLNADGVRDLLQNELSRTERLRFLLISRKALIDECAPFDVIPLLKAGVFDAIIASPLLLQLELGLHPQMSNGDPAPVASIQEARGVLWLHDVAIEKRLLSNPRAVSSYLLSSPPFQHIMPSSALSQKLGRYLKEKERLLKEPESLLSVAYTLGVPILTPYLIASQLGKLLAALALGGNRLTHDPAIDLNEMAGMIHESQQSGAGSLFVSLCGSGPLWFVLRTLQFLDTSLGIKTDQARILTLLADSCIKRDLKETPSVQILKEEAPSKIFSAYITNMPSREIMAQLDELASALPERAPRSLENHREDLVERLRKSHMEATTLKRWPPLRMRFPKRG
ncbi:MAG: deoxyhypusine synthase family protein [Candidatus Eisenbacteria bacterium]|uniref:Deoxyhypusine synthase family protein n=1 Tax=Eiseniibacteriota bacterium TaxID=2212470 RepID=A0A948WC34_UNCEI|nr:deoxyhypusine synthase family protein [Candidatus Eisenbacteria bacterium]MBU1951092.1 deoxyhypusine synthase family protein [Candidatus Eisenbacteria bacterium]MBU2690548.1 deoxyhypusine synthase family protein [Candidatus Eisenbacteria bacterium]